MKRRHKAVIVGAGIGGPVLALWLQRLGLEVAVIEARPSPALAEGAFLGVAPNGLGALDALGLAPRITERGHPCDGFQFVNQHGRPIGATDRRGDRQAFGWPLVMIRRGELHALLAAACAERGLTPGFGRRVTAIEQQPDGVAARCSDGTTVDGDFLIGCDGLRSKTRALCIPGAPVPRFTGLLDFGGFARVPGLPIPSGINHMVFGRRAFFGAFVTPDGETWWFHNGPPAAGDEALTAAAHKARLCELHRDDPPWISEVIAATEPLLGPWRIHELVAMPRWSAGRVCLLGDAAHAMSPSAGQGASLALEDALVLAQCLRDVGDARAAFRLFEALRRPRVEAIFRAARRNSNNKAPSPWGAWFRDRLLPLFLRLGARAQSQAYAFRLDWEARVA
jgi:2-polyprenyl-6-methoxyphenol hydroxylase-like FAD-dependent oxidoreductase